MDTKAESTSLRQFVGLDDPAMAKIIEFCLQEELLKQADVDNLQEAIDKLG